MMYLIGQLAIWLLLTAAFAALAGWAFATERAASGEEASRRERENLLRDLVRFNGDDAPRFSNGLREKRGEIADVRADVSGDHAVL